MPRTIALRSADVRREWLERLERQNSDVARKALVDLKWQAALYAGLRHLPFLIVEEDSVGEVLGALPVSQVKSALFGRYLVGLPYVNTGGVIARDGGSAARLIDAAAQLADQLDVRYLELRHETEIAHPRLAHTNSSKVHMRLSLPDSSDALWKQVSAKVRNQIRKGEKSELAVSWGRHELIDAYYQVFSHNMRDLGTPCYGKTLFRAILDEFVNESEICVVRHGDCPVAAALLIHGRQCTQVPSASSLRAFNHLNANMLMYWHLLCRAVERRAAVFDFGRSTIDSGTFHFKKQWGAEPVPAYWQYYPRKGDVGERRPENPRFRRAIAVWQKLPVPLTRLIGPPIVRGIP